MTKTKTINPNNAPTAEELIAIEQEAMTSQGVTDAELDVILNMETILND